MIRHDYSIELKKVHFRTVLLRYEDSEGMLEAHLEQSTVSDFDWIGAELDLGVRGERLQQVLSRIQEWASANDTRIKFCPKDQLKI